MGPPQPAHDLAESRQHAEYVVRAWRSRPLRCPAQNARQPSECDPHRCVVRTDGVWAPYWHHAVEASAGFAEPRAEASFDSLPKKFKKRGRLALPDYEKMREYRSLEPCAENWLACDHDQVIIGQTHDDGRPSRRAAPVRRRRGRRGRAPDRAPRSTRPSSDLRPLRKARRAPVRVFLPVHGRKP